TLRLPRSAAPAWALGDHDLDRALFTGPHDIQAHPFAHRIATQHVEQLLEALEALAVERHHDVTKQQTRFGRRGVFLDRDEQQTAALVEPHRLHGGADPAAGDVAALKQLRHDTVDRLHR